MQKRALVGGWGAAELGRGGAGAGPDERIQALALNPCFRLPPIAYSEQTPP
jgi:hypothetical protein